MSEEASSRQDKQTRFKLMDRRDFDTLSLEPAALFRRRSSHPIVPPS